MSGAAERRKAEPEPKRVLIVRVGAMGDVLHGLPAVAALRRMHPEWRIDWAVDTRWADLLVGSGRAGPDKAGPVVSNVVPVRTRLWKERPLSRATWWDVLGLRRRLRGGSEQGGRYDVCVDLQGTMRSAVIGWMAGSRRYVGPKEPREGPAMHLYRETVAARAEHVIDQAGEILGQALGEALPVADWKAGGMLPKVEAAEEWADALMEQVGGRGRLVVLAPTAGWPSKEWGAARFGEAAARLAREGWVVLVNTGPVGGPTIEAMVVASGGSARAVPCTIAELTSLLRRASLFLGGDTGPMHLADTLGVPVVALFGPTDPARTGPRGPNARVLRHPASVTDHRRHRETEAGLARITVEEVMQAAMDLLAATEDRAG